MSADLSFDSETREKVSDIIAISMLRNMIYVNNVARIK
jgi:hypothetical protein